MLDADDLVFLVAEIVIPIERAATLHEQRLSVRDAAYLDLGGSRSSNFHGPRVRLRNPDRHHG
jgi:hypothetical protein